MQECVLTYSVMWLLYLAEKFKIPIYCFKILPTLRKREKKDKALMQNVQSN